MIFREISPKTSIFSPRSLIPTDHVLLKYPAYKDPIQKSIPSNTIFSFTPSLKFFNVPHLDTLNLEYTTLSKIAQGENVKERIGLVPAGRRSPPSFLQFSVRSLSFPTLTAAEKRQAAGTTLSHIFSVITKKHRKTISPILREAFTIFPGGSGQPSDPQTHVPIDSSVWSSGHLRQACVLLRWPA